jgi:Uma2 family endonuclease
MSAAPRFPTEPGYTGLRMTAEAFLALGETHDRYELIDGVVVMSPSASFGHNEMIAEIVYQLKLFAGRGGDGGEGGGGEIRIAPETDITFGPGRVYRPNISVFRSSRLPAKVISSDIIPDLIVEVLSPGSKVLDLITKRDDYERAGVQEYWAADPENGSIRRWQRQGSQLCEMPIDGDALASGAFPGLVLDLKALRAIAGR